jgi:1-acyl-sn-glycerol-3-phosphate acyltransferase
MMRVLTGGRTNRVGAVEGRHMSDESIDYDSSWGRRPLALVGREILLMGILRSLIWLHNRPKVYGRERLEGLHGPVLFAANHASHLDTPVILMSLPKPFRRRTGVVAAADYFFKNRFKAGFVTLAFATLPIERSSVSNKTAERVEQMVSERWNMLLFPEGTRTKDGKMSRLKQGTAYMANQYRMPIVPVYLTGTFESHGKGSNWPTPRPVTVRFGRPLHPLEPGQHRKLTDQLRESFVELAAEAGRLEP